MRYLPIFIISLILFPPVLSYADIYKWTDANGVVHYSDKPQAGAVPVCLPSDQSYRSAVPASLVSPAVNSKAPVSSVYTRLRIIQPANNYTYVNNAQGNIAIVVKVQPALQHNDKIQITLDGKLVGEITSDNILNLMEIDRGQHIIQAQIINNGKVLLRSEDVVFNMQRPKAHKPKLR